MNTVVKIFVIVTVLVGLIAGTLLLLTANSMPTDPDASTFTEVERANKTAHMKMVPMPQGCKPPYTPFFRFPHKEWRQLFDGAKYEGVGRSSLNFVVRGQYAEMYFNPGELIGKREGLVDKGMVYESNIYQIFIVSSSNDDLLVGPLYLFGCKGAVYINDQHLRVK